MSNFNVGDSVRDRKTGFCGKVSVVMGNKVHLYKIQIDKRRHVWRFEMELEAENG